MLVSDKEFLATARPIGFGREQFTYGMEEVLKRAGSSDLKEFYDRLFFYQDHSTGLISVSDTQNHLYQKMVLSEDHSVVPAKDLIPHFSN